MLSAVVLGYSHPWATLFKTCCFFKTLVHFGATTTFLIRAMKNLHVCA
uniref:Uncharacterized protein n=1 Tax=Anguilla anguilla TaxID=7936 RepID=A0A0E9U902_ANGAN